MKNRYILASASLLLVFLSYPKNLLSQDEEPNVVPPSPNVVSLGKYGDIPISLYSGTPNISIPLYEVVNGDITLPISVSYHASGVRVAEEASRVGLGWVLNAGGVIGRSIVGVDDFAATPTSYHNKNAPELPKGFINGPLNHFQNNCNLVFNGPPGFSMPSQFIDELDYDFEPDQYNYNFLDNSGKFILKQNKEVVLSKQEKIEIVCLDDDGNSWEVRTKGGTIYTFDTYETVRDNGGLFGPSKSAWYLTKIKSTTGDSVTLYYQNLGVQYIKPVGSFSEQLIDFTIGCTLPPGYGQPPPPTGFQQMVPGKEYDNVLLDYIDYPHGQVVFSYSARDDVEGDQKLDAVEVYRRLPSGAIEATAFKEFLFSYDYFVSDTDKDFDEQNVYATKRLKLQSITERGTNGGVSTTKPPHLFTYYEGTNFTNLPAKTSFARDHWGYYNGKLSNTSLIPSYQTLSSANPVDFYIGLMGDERNSNSLYSTAFSLKTIEYPTGGETEFQYESHDIDPELSLSRDQSYFANVPTFTQDVSKTMFYDGQNRGAIYEQALDLSDEYVDEFGNYQNTTLDAVFRVSNSCTDIVGVPNVYFELYDEAGGRISEVTLGLPSCSTAVELTCIYCDPSGQSPVFSYKNEYSLAPGIYTWKAFISSGSDGDEFEDISATYTYRSLVSSQPSAFTKAGGLRINKIIDKDGVSSANDIIRTFNYHYFEDKNGDGVDEEYSYGLLMAQPRYTHFLDKYTSIAGPGGATLCVSTSVTRSSESNIPLNGSASGSIAGYSQVTVTYGENAAFGKSVYHYDNQPDMILNFSSPSSSFVFQLVPRKPPSRPNIPFEKNGLLIHQEDFKSEGGVFVKISETINTYGASPNDTSVTYAIEKRPPLGPNATCNELLIYPTIQNNIVNLTSSVQKTYDQDDPSKFLQVQTDFRYDNIEHLQLTKQTTTDSEGKIIETQYKYALDYNSPATIINQMVNNHMHSQVVEQITRIDGLEAYATGIEYQLTNNFILPKSMFRYETIEPGLAFSESNDGATFLAYTKRLNYGRYDGAGNLLEFNRSDDVVTSFIWGYDQTLPVAQIVNASFSEVEGILGSNFDGGPDGLETGEEQTLRDNLTESQITTYTYDPLIGVTSITDPRGLTSLYQYDGSNRLQWIIDHQGNIVKKYEYVYASDGSQ